LGVSRWGELKNTIKNKLTCLDVCLINFRGTNQIDGPRRMFD
jgi:hypothetical protein